MIAAVMDECDRLAISRDLVVVVHADLGQVEWFGTKELARYQAARYGLRFEVVKREQGDLLEHARSRKKWFSPKQRYCTSDHKRGQVHRLFTKLTQESRRSQQRVFRVRILDVMGIRADESRNRAKLSPWERNDRASNGRRDVWTWLPIHGWSEKQVWDSIRARDVPHHFAYDLGMPRLSCCFCIFAPEAAIKLAAKHNRDLLDRYIEVEDEIGHSFKDPKSSWQLRSIRDAIDNGDDGDDGHPIVSWEM